MDKDALVSERDEIFAFAFTCDYQRFAWHSDCGMLRRHGYGLGQGQVSGDYEGWDCNPLRNPRRLHGILRSLPALDAEDDKRALQGCPQGADGARARRGV